MARMGPRYAAESATVRTFGSPTILVNGKDISGAAPSGGADCCRLYRSGDGRLAGVPEVRELTRALMEARESEARNEFSATKDSTWHEIIALLPVIGVSLLPKLTCPAC